MLKEVKATPLNRQNLGSRVGNERHPGTWKRQRLKGKSRDIPEKLAVRTRLLARIKASRSQKTTPAPEHGCLLPSVCLKVRAERDMTIPPLLIAPLHFPVMLQVLQTRHLIQEAQPLPHHPIRSPTHKEAGGWAQIALIV